MPGMLSIVIPASREGPKLGSTLQAVQACMVQLNTTHEIIVVSDGSTEDISILIGETYDQRIRILHCVRNRGKGAALRTGIHASKGAYVFLIDAASPFPFDFFSAALRMLQKDDVGAVICAQDGSGSQAGHSFPKLSIFMERVFTLRMRRVLPNTDFDPRYCIKGFKGDVIRSAALFTQINGLTFDIEVLLILRLWKQPVVIHPVRMRNYCSANMPPARDTIAMLVEIARMRKSLKKKRYPTDIPSLKLESTRCPVDQHPDSRVFALVDESFRFCVCNQCKTLYQNPRLVPSEIINQYQAGYFATNDPRSGYMDYARTLSQQHQTAKWIWDRILSTVKEPISRVLDVGCGSGAFLQEAQKRGMEGWGNDLCKLVDDADFQFVQGDFLTTRLAGPFDAVVFNDSLEHFPEPYEPLRRAHELLKERGLLVINTPDVNSWLLHLSGDRWISLKHEHLFLLPRKQLAQVLYSTGFSLEHRIVSRQYVDCDYLKPRLHLLSPMLARLFGIFARMMGNRSFRMPTGDMLLLARRLE